MRAVALAVGIIVFAVTMMQLGFCQGETACVRECQTEHCTAAGTGLSDCSSEAFRACAQGCRDATNSE